MEVLNQIYEAIKNGNLGFVLIAILAFLFNKHISILDIYSRIKDRKLNKYKKYGDDFISMEENDTLEKQLIINEKKEILLQQLTGIKDEDERYKYAFLVLNSKCLRKYDTEIKKILPYLSKDEQGYSKFNMIEYKKNTIKNYIYAFFYFMIMMFFAYLFNYSALDYAKNNAPSYFPILMLLGMIFFEFVALYYRYKPVKKNRLMKLIELIEKARF